MICDLCRLQFLLAGIGQLTFTIRNENHIGLFKALSVHQLDHFTDGAFKVGTATEECFRSGQLILQRVFARTEYVHLTTAASHAGGHWFESSSLHQTLGILMISRVFSFIKKMIVFCFTVLSLYFLSKLIVFYRNEKETLSRLFFHYLSCTFLPLMWSMLMRNIWTALPEAATSSSTIFSVG